ncbi:phosphatase PAP2 family protein [Pedobacter paludis]|uniref:PAP2 family protein n=1 Tax=Pedobacter paludis TaxID=2203212 RepID=A0A317ETX5_9SPHI|nr:phosphatase PAP2 family protein [Pedobacter paludis]PWS30391.1 PAP2 family protein [Pedobacter paludis]
MRRFFFFLLLSIGFFSICSAQVIDSTSIAPVDSTAKWYAGNPMPKSKFKPVAFIAPAVLMGYGFAAVYDHGALMQLDVSTKAELQEDHPLFAAHVDDYLQFAPAAAVYALNLSGVKGKHNLFDASMLYVTSATIMCVSTHFVKQGVGRERPNNNGNNSFPSGHTASAFMAAEFLHQEYKDVSPWIGYAGYFVATATGTLRMYNNKHWFSDVVAGAGFGIASTKIAYLVYPYMKSLFTTKKAGNFTLMPFHQPGTNGLMLSGRF